MNEMTTESQELERQAMALVKQYGLFMPAPIKEFLKKLATYLQWETLKGTLK